MSDFEKHYFTFGASHRMPDGSPGFDCYVEVEAPANHRGLFLAWADGMQWAFEYSEDEWIRRDGAFRWYKGRPPYARITVTQTASRTSYDG